MLKRNNQKGFMTVDFIFAFVLVMGFFVIMFTLTMTLTVVEVTQYITFASARSYSVSHINEARQREEGFNKFKQLTENPVLQPLFTNGWFEIDLTTPIIGDVSDIKTDYGKQPFGINLFRGTGTNFKAKILDFRVPFFGSTTNESEGEGFKTFIGSYLSREVTFGECRNFNNGRWDAIKAIPVDGAAPYSSVQQQNSYASISDNGC